MYMQGRRSQNLAIIVYDPEIERTFRQQRRQAERTRSNTQLSSNSELKEIIVNGNQSPKKKMAGAEEEVVNNQKSPMKESYIPLHTDQPSTILYPPNTAGNFTLTAQLLNMVPHYHGLPNEDPYLHIKEFFELCVTQQIQGVTPEGIRLRLFPFSLKDKAKLWLNSLDAGSITSWEQLASKFLKKFFPAQKTRQLRREIQTFQQKDGDQFWEAWEHFKDLLWKCPHHNLTKDDQVQAFYEGLNELNRGIVDSACGGALMEKNSEEAYELFGTLSENSQQFSCRTRQMGKKQGVYEVQSQGNVTTQMAAMDKKIDMIIKAMASNSMLGQTSKEVCAICSHTNHTTECCPMSSFTDQEHANYVGNTFPKQNNPYSNTYNPGWRNHPNFSWGSNQNNQNNQGNQQQYQGQQRNYQHPQNNFSQNSAQKPPEDEFKSLVTQFIQSSQANFQQHSQAITNTQQSLAKLEAQMGQIANALSKREDGKFPSQTEINPKNHEHLKAITTITKEPEKVYRRMRQHGTVIDTSMNGPYENPKTVDIEPQVSAGQNEIDVNRKSDKKSTDIAATPIQVTTSKEPERVYKPVPPYPQRLRQERKSQFTQDIFETLRKVEINIPLIDAIKQIPSYAKFIKELCTNKRRFKDHEEVKLTEEVSAVLSRKLPPKLKDPGSFTITCKIGDHMFERALLDLGSSINLLPFSVYEYLSLGELKPTSITLQLVDRSVKHRRGILEDILVKVGEFILPADFVVLDMESVSMPHHLSIILGRPFMATAGSKIDVQKGTIEMKVNGQKIEFKVFEAMKMPRDEDCFQIEVIEQAIGEVFPRAHGCKEELDTCIQQGLIKSEIVRDSDEFEATLMEIVNQLEVLPSIPSKYSNSYEILGSSTKPPIRSVIKAPELELKPLPEHLKYAYLGEHETLPCIIASDLSSDEESKLLKVLKAHKTALGWSLADIKGISPTMCMH